MNELQKLNKKIRGKIIANSLLESATYANIIYSNSFSYEPLYLYAILVVTKNSHTFETCSEWNNFMNF